MARKISQNTKKSFEKTISEEQTEHSFFSMDMIRYCIINEPQKNLREEQD
jgi:hypothetical protein